MDKKQHKYKFKQLLQVYLKKRSKYYQQEGYKYAQEINNAFLLERMFAFTVDVCVMFLPIALWGVLFIMMLGSLLPVFLYNILQWSTLIALVISISIFNGFLSAKSGGQTLGKYFHDLKVVKSNHREATGKALFMREFIGFSLPTLIALIFTNVLGVFVFWILNFLFVLLHPRHVSIIDMFFRTRIVILRETSSQILVEDEVEEGIIEEKNTIDLHIHSNFSDDGQFNVEEIFQMASKLGLKTISICDHNSIKSNAVAKRMSSLYHVNYIPGIELDCQYNQKQLRILGYFVNYTSDIYAHLENESLTREKAASLKRVELFENFSGISIDVNQLLEKNRYQKITGRLIAKQVLANELVREHPMIQPYLVGEKRYYPEDAFEKDFFAKGEPCYVEVHHPKLEDILDVIKLTGGVPVLAYGKEVLRYGETFMDEVLNKGIEGIEVFSPYHNESDMVKLLKIAKEHKIFVTGGSDFHGVTKSKNHLGYTNCPIEAEKLIRDFIQSHA